MSEKTASLVISAALAVALLCPGCATFMELGTQQVPVTSAPVGATVSLNGRPQGVTPLEIKLARKAKDQVLRIESDGYNPLEIRVKRRVSAGKLIMDVALGAAAGVGAALLYEAITPNTGYTVLAIGIPAGMIVIPAVDLASGRIYDLVPAELTVTLTKAEGSPRVDTMFLDPDKLQNVKWIRVRTSVQSRIAPE